MSLEEDPQYRSTILVVGMGTEIQVKSNLLGHYSMRDLNDNSNICSWPPYPRDNVLPNSLYYNGYLPRSATKVYPVLGKDILKQTMLEQEAIFRKQVLELHFLYTKQKELMNEFKRQDMFKGRMAVETSLASSPLASQITSEEVAKWHSPGVPLVNSSYNLRPFTSAVEGIQSPASSARVNCTQAADVPSPVSFGGKSSELLESTRPSKVRRKMFDLQLPANRYIDDDEPEQAKDDKFPEILATTPKEDAMADHGNGVILPGLYSGVKSVVDLNKPLEVDETTGSAHVHLHSQSLAQSSNLGNSNEVASSHSVIASNNGGGWLSILESGEGKGKRSVSQGDQMQKLLVSEVSMEQKQLGRSRGRHIHGLDTFESDNCPESVTSSHLSPRYLFSSPPDPAKSWSKSVTNFERQGNCSFNQKMPSQNGLSLETMSCSYVKVVQPSGIQGGSGDKQQFQSELPYQNGFHPGSSSSCSREPPSQPLVVTYDHYAYRSEDIALKELMQNRNDEKHHWHSSSEVRSATRLVDLNATLLSGPSGGQAKAKKMENRPKIPTWLLAETGFNNEAALRQVDLNAAVLGGPSSGMVNKGKKMEDHPKIRPWLKPETGFWSEDHSFANRDTGLKNEMGRGLEGNKTLSRSIALVSYYDDDRNNSGQCPRDKKILGFRISEKGASRPSEGTVSDYDRKTRLNINLLCNSVPELAKPSSPGYFLADKGDDLKVSHCIDLNLVISEDEDSAMPYVPSKPGKRIPDIDLEAPAAPEEEFGFVYGSEVVEENGEKSRLSVDEGMVSAAEAIVAISATVHYGFSLDKICFLTGCMEDPLNWFADVTVSCLNDVETRSAAAVSKCKQTRRQDGETTSEDIDDFESMTLKLTEMKSEDYFPKPFVPGIPIEDVSVVNPTSSHRRRGQARRGRQRRDFQRDILPGLVSLSRHEVTEDLRTFGGLMRATGHLWQSGLTRRNSRNGSAMGRRRISAASVIASQTTLTYAPLPLVQQQSAVKVGLEGRSLTSWGKTTRRPRRQRCAMSNSPGGAIVSSTTCTRTSLIRRNL